MLVDFLEPDDGHAAFGHPRLIGDQHCKKTGIANPLGKLTGAWKKQQILGPKGAVFHTILVVNYLIEGSISVEKNRRPEI